MIYATQATTGGPVKIGYSDNVPARIRQLERHYDRRLLLLATLPGSEVEERAIHDRFAHLRLGYTEQFRPAADLMVFLGLPIPPDPSPEAMKPMSGRSASRGTRGTSIRIPAATWALVRQAAFKSGRSPKAWANQIVREHAEAELLNEAYRIVQQA